MKWLEAILKQPPPRVERTNHAKQHVLLPDGYWDPPKAIGGIGAVLKTSAKNAGLGVASVVGTAIDNMAHVW